MRLMTLAFAAIVPVLTAADSVVLNEPFDGRFQLGWTIVREDAEFLSLAKRPGELVMTTQAGTIYSNLERDHFAIARNILLLKRPLSDDDNFVATLHVSAFTPNYEDQHVSLILYQSDDSYFRYSAACGSDDATTKLRAVAERNAGCTPWYDAEQPMDGPFWLRLTRRGGKYRLLFSDDGDEFRDLRGVGFTPADPDQPIRIGFYATNGSESAPPSVEGIDVVVESFRLRLD